MKIMVPVAVKYKGDEQSPYTPFNCDSSDFQSFVPLGAWAIVDEDEKPKQPVKPKGKESK